MNAVKSIVFSARVVGSYADALATVVFADGSTKHFTDHDALAAMLTFAFGYAVPQLDDAPSIVALVPERTGKPLPPWVTL